MKGFMTIPTKAETKGCLTKKQNSCRRVAASRNSKNEAGALS